MRTADGRKEGGCIDIRSEPARPQLKKLQTQMCFVQAKVTIAVQRGNEQTDRTGAKHESALLPSRPSAVQPRGINSLSTNGFRLRRGGGVFFP